MTRRLITTALTAAAFGGAAWLMLSVACSHLPQLEQPLAARRTVDPATGWDGVRDYRRWKTTECKVCGGTDTLVWAHYFPQNLSTGKLEYLRYVQTNGVTLCREHHLAWGHPTGTHYYTAGLAAAIDAFELKPTTMETR